ncbi:hypothetical protein GUITHDRAFT_150444 [Guillardia theta CCMP2712]|uniref:NIPSNAP domain-containing protein n=1 Tax=Guillardia theta (strain CCMP2712) TaxID=905079 RepID=L1JXK6_GUITC|nr:hypothetical protein GUITHDRAFT_150444 [Guillardia theta CCMP2712]EKX52813.1 hypothetical protein GUITHDRAFT_150444 [Guillardia theta CCMP2712]|eukprot:XP_005839793.1 hypothetical protein GUITHDRAFT_150444 [Guillardia theta CCMP2712]
MIEQNNMVFLEATDILKDVGLKGAVDYESPASKSLVSYELRRYQLKLGYHIVPQFLKSYGCGLPDKLNADDSGASTLVTLLYSDCGTLNTVLELWRHESIERSQDSRKASRNAEGWKKSIAEIAEIANSFDNQFLRPTAFSPWK